MAITNYTENTLYGNKGTQSPLVNFPSLTKSIQQKSQTASTDVYKNALEKQLSLKRPTMNFGSGVTASTAPDTGIPVGQQVKPFEPGAKTQGLPEGYDQFVTSAAGDPWSTPSDQAVARNWPTALGGGQYITDPTQPGALIKSSRAIMEPKINPGAKQKILGKLSPQDYQVDHIVPLWIGGADTLQNLEVFDNITHAKKTAIQAVPLTLLANGKIDLNQAKVMALTWKDKDASSLPDINYIDSPITKNENGKTVMVKPAGQLTLAEAQRVAQKWEDENKPSFFRDIKRYFGQSLRENMSAFGKDVPVLGEFSKGLVGGGTAGIVPGTEATPESGIVGGVSNFAGNLVGTLTGIGLVGKLAGRLGLLGKTAKLSTAPLSTYEGLGFGLGKSTALLEYQKASAITIDAMKAAGLTTTIDVGNVAKTASKAFTETKLPRMASSALVLGLWGQLGLTGRELTGQEKFELSNHVKRAATDIAYGGLLGASGQTLKGYGNVALWSTVIPLMEGQDIVPALQNGVLMAALHGMGYQKGVINPKLRIGESEAYKMALNHGYKWVGDAIPTIEVGGQVPAKIEVSIDKINNRLSNEQRTSPNDLRIKNLRPATDQKSAVVLAQRIAEKEMGNQVARSIKTKVVDGKEISYVPKEMIEKIKADRQALVTSFKLIDRYTLSPETRDPITLQDIYSFGDKIRPPKQKMITASDLRPAQNKTELVNRLRKLKPEDLTKEIPNTANAQFVKGTTAITGEEMTPETRAVLADLGTNPQLYAEKFAVIKDPEVSTIMRFINSELAAQGKPPVIADPNQTLQVFALKKTIAGYEPRFIGNIPEKRSYNEKKYALNEPFFQAFKKAKTENPELADADIEARLAANGMIKYDAETMNTNNISSEMDKYGIQTLLADKAKVYGLGGGKQFTFGEINLNDQTWLRSMPKYEVAPQTPPTTEISAPIVPQVAKKPKPITRASTPKEQDRQTYKKIENTINQLVQRASDEGRSFITSKKGKFLPEGITETELAQSKIETAELNSLMEQLSTLTKKYKNIPQVSGGRPKSNTFIPKTDKEVFNTYEEPMPYGRTEKKLETQDLYETQEQTYVTKLAKEKIEEMKDPNITPTEKEAKVEEILNLAGKFEISSPITERNIKELLTEVPTKDFITEDVRLAQKWGLAIKKDKTGQWWNLETKGKNQQPIFSQETLQSHPEYKGKLPIDIFGKDFANDMRAFDFGKSTAAREIMRSFNKNAQSSVPEIKVGGVFGKEVLKEMSAKLKAKGEKSPALNWTISSYFKERNPFMKKMLGETYPFTQKSTDQPHKRLIESVEGASKERIASIDEATNAANPQLGRLTEAELGTEVPTVDLYGEKSTAGIDTADLRDTSIKNPLQLDKQKDLLLLESKMPWLMYENLTGKKPPIEAVAQGWQNFFQEMLGDLNIKLKKESKPGIFIDLKAIKQKALDSVNPKLFQDGSGGPDGQGGLWGGVTRGVSNAVSNISKDASTLSSLVKNFVVPYKAPQPTTTPPPLGKKVHPEIPLPTPVLQPKVMPQSTPAINTQFIDDKALTQRNNTIISNTRADFPFTPQAQKVLDTVHYNRAPSLYADVASNVVKGFEAAGQQSPGGRWPTAFAPIEYFAKGVDKLTGGDAYGTIGQKLDPIKITISDKYGWDAETTVAHESLHALYQTSPMYKNPTEWNNAWEQAKFDDTTNGHLSGIDYDLSKAGYNTSNLDSMGTERYAYLGVEVLKHGIGAIPAPLRPFYSQFIAGVNDYKDPVRDPGYLDKLLYYLTEREGELRSLQNGAQTPPSTPTPTQEGAQTSPFQAPNNPPDGGRGPYGGQGGQGGLWGGIKDKMGWGPVVYNSATYVPPATTTPPVTPPPPPPPKPVIVQPKVTPPPAPTKITLPKIQMPTYDARGIKVTDQDLAEAANILYAEVSNRPPEKQQFEVRHIINTALNRAANNPKGFGKTLTEVLQRPYQYQGYAPQGMTVKGGKVVESQYQKVKAGKIDEAGKVKLKAIQDAINEIKTGKFEDTTSGSMFYVHASDGTLWLGKTSKEAKQNANNHEKALKLPKTPWGTVVGLPAQIAKR